LCQNIPRLVPGWTQAIIIGRHAYGDQYKATDCVVKPYSKVELVITPTDGKGEPQRIEVFTFKESGGVSLSMYVYKHFFVVCTCFCLHAIN
jgi:isocitrate dehydrogenase